MPTPHRSAQYTLGSVIELIRECPDTKTFTWTMPVQVVDIGSKTGTLWCKRVHDARDPQAEQYKIDPASGRVTLWNRGTHTPTMWQIKRQDPPAPLAEPPPPPPPAPHPQLF